MFFTLEQLTELNQKGFFYSIYVKTPFMFKSTMNEDL